MGRRGAVVVDTPEDHDEATCPECLKEASRRYAIETAPARVDELESELAVLRSRVDELERVVRRAR